MLDMIRFEWKKIFDRRFNMAAMAVGYLLIVICTVSFIKETSFYDTKTDSYINGIRAYEMSREKCEGMTDYLTEEYLTDLTKSIQEQYISLGEDEGYMQVIRPIGSDLIWILCDNYMDMREYVSWNKINEIPTDGGIGFYQRRLEKISDFLNMDFSYGNYSDAEKEFWLTKAENVKTPFRWGSKTAMDSVWDIIQIAFYLMFVIAICVVPVFASEYESGAAALLLTTKNGKTKLIYAKILAAVVFSLLYMSVGIGCGVGIAGLAVGFYGANLPVQLWGTIIPYDWSIGKACVISFAVLLLIALTITFLTLFLSSRVKSSIVVLVLDFVLLIAPAFFPMSKASGLWNHINYLFPIRAMSIKDVLKTLNSYQFGPVILSYLGMIVLVYLLVSIGSFFGIKGGFAKHQVK